MYAGAADEEKESAATEDESRKGEADEDHSSVALASLSKARLTAKQIDSLDREMRDRNLQLLQSITNPQSQT
ncbi:hypothetical protein BM221_002028 [Beauveria bassiana]|nr:hypothetical protein BM221_002028 [Beauveria bassiana]